MEAELLTIQELAERWRFTVDQAKRVVREEDVPFVGMRSASLQVNWSLIRFTLSEVREWERRRQRVFTAPEPPRPTLVRAGKLGDWRRS